MIKDINCFYFSPSGDTEKIVTTVAKDLARNLKDLSPDEIMVNFCDVLKNPMQGEKTFSQESVLVIGAPAIMGQLPQECVEMLDLMNGDGAAVVAVICHPGHGYGDALYELYTRLRGKQFNVVSAAAFLSRHSAIANGGEDRPDERDFRAVARFGRVTSSKLKRLFAADRDFFGIKQAPLNISGSMPIKPGVRIGTVSYDVNDCADFDPQEVDIERGAIASPYARAYMSPIVNAWEVMSEKLLSRRKEPEIFV